MLVEVRPRLPAYRTNHKDDQAMSKSSERTKPSNGSTNRLSRIQDLQVSALHRVSEAVARLVPPLPRSPLADRFPSARRLVDDNFDRARRLLENQRRFTLALVEAVEPVTRKVAARERPKKKAARSRRPMKKSRPKPVKAKPLRVSKRRAAS